jgi:NhaA family Na+:H+ antiporter
MIRALRFAGDRYLALPVGALAALAWANSLPDSYFRFAHACSFAVNDVAMLFFFALVTAEILEATVPGGDLHTWRRIAVPISGAAGGILGSACVWFAYLRTGDEWSLLARGWPVPTAVDLALGYAVARAIWGRHPAIPFFLLLGIASDALGVVLVGLLYPVADGHPDGILLVAAAIASAIVLRRCGVRNFWPYVLVCGTVSWWGFFLSGWHPALALVPIMPFLTHAKRERQLFSNVPARTRDALGQFDRAWRYPVQVVVLLFALVNAGVMMRGFGTATKAAALAALAGKPLGILAAIGLAVALGLRLPRRVGWRDVIVAGCTASIGFTFSLFFATAAFPIGPVLAEAKLGALFTVGGAMTAFAAAALLRVGRFAASPARRLEPAAVSIA